MTTTTISPQVLERLVLKDEVEQFVYREAALLDERRYEEWIDLMAEDIHYFMPIRKNIKFDEWDRENSDTASEISWFDEGKEVLEGRVRQLMTGVHWAEEPVSRIRHIISNVRVLDVRGDEVETADNFFVWHNRLLEPVRGDANQRPAPRSGNGVQGRQADHSLGPKRFAGQGRHLLLLG
jgi:3-phenylpropionate/cinnamic acid dioxygenase small subunit